MYQREGSKQHAIVLPSESFMDTSSLCMKLNKLSHRMISTTTVFRSASPCDEGLTLETLSVCQMLAILRLRVLSSNQRWYGIPSSQMVSASFRIFCTRLCFSSSVQWFTWVGWAVRMISTVWLIRLLNNICPSTPSCRLASAVQELGQYPGDESRLCSWSVPRKPLPPSFVMSIFRRRHCWWASAVLATPRKVGERPGYHHQLLGAY